MSSEFRREYLVRLPLPLAQLYSRAYNAKDGRSRHDNCFYLFEALIKLTSCSLIASYVDGIRRGDRRSGKLDKPLAQLALPSLGQWVGFVRELSRHFAERPDAATHSMGHLYGQLDAKRGDLEGVLALYQRIKNGPDGKPSGSRTCSLLQVIDSLVQYRNAVFGHGAGRVESFYENEMGPLLFPAINDFLADGVLDLIGRSGSRLVYLSEVRKVEEDRVELGLRELVGQTGERAAPLPLTAEQGESLLPNRLAILHPGSAVPVTLDPLLHYREDELSEDVLFLNRDRNGSQVEFLSYTTGQTIRDKETAPSLAALLSTVTGKRIDEDRLEELQDDDSVEEVVEDYSDVSLSRPIGRLMGDYEILAEVGRGGMGVVYLARQLSLGRLVALKMLTPELVNDEVSLARFRREMRALGRCDHPNIVKVIATGTMPRGELFYTMEYVPGADLEQALLQMADDEGDSSVGDLSGSSFTGAVYKASRRRHKETFDSTTVMKDEALADSGVSDMFLDLDDTQVDAPLIVSKSTTDLDSYTRRVVELMRDAALALQAVHDQNIIHRDVKPANLLLTADSSRLVLMDFGLAKGSSLASGVTEAGGFVGTLRYSAPEQLAAATIQVGPTADIRGLGVTMWELLTRQKLFAEAEDERQLSQRVFETDVPLLSTIDAGFDPDLEAIVSRSVERNSSDRIQTARELADYLDLYLQGKPIPIRTPGAGELLRRWMADHKPLVAAVGVSATVIMMVVTVAFVMITNSRDEERLARIAAQESEDKEEKAKLAATAARAEAVERFRDAREAVEKSLLGVSEALEDFPGVQSLRMELLEQAAADYARFAENRSDDPDLQGESARALIRLGKVRLRMRQFEQALEAGQAAETMLAKLSKQVPDRDDFQLDIVDCRSQQAAALCALHRHEESQKKADEAAELVKKLLAARPEDPELQRTQAAGLVLRGHSLLTHGDPARSVEVLQNAVNKYRGIEPTGTENRSGLASALNTLGSAFVAVGTVEDAVDTATEAEKLWKGTVAAFPDEPDFLAGRASALLIRNSALQILGRSSEQVDVCRRAVQDFEDLVVALPDVPTHRLNLAATKTSLAQVLNRLGRNGDAQAEAVDSLTTMFDLMTIGGQDATYIAETAAAQTILARVLGEVNELSLSKEHFFEALSRYDVLVDAVADNTRFQEDRVLCQANAAVVLHRLGQSEQAVELLKATIDELDELIAIARKTGGDESATFLLDAQAKVWMNLGDLFHQTGPPIEAEKAYAQTLRILDETATQPEYVWRLVRFLSNCPDIRMRDSERAWNLGSQIVQKLPRNHRVWSALGIAALRSEKWDAAIKAFDRAASLQGAADSIDQLFVAMAYHGRAEDGDQERATQILTEARAAIELDRPTHSEAQRVLKEALEGMGMSGKKTPSDSPR